MPLKIWTSPLSWNCLRPELVLAEKGIVDVERIPADLISGKHKTPDFLTKSIFGKVPLLQDDKVVLFESRAICRYLCEKYAGVGPELTPDFTESGSRGVWEMRLILEAVEFNDHFGPLIQEILIKPAMGQASDEAALGRHRSKLDKCLDILDAQLSTMSYMGGDSFSLVDIMYMPGVYFVSTRVDMFEGRANLKKWWDSVSAREAWVKSIQPVDQSWMQVVPGWKSSTARTPGQEEGGLEAHL